MTERKDDPESTESLEEDVEDLEAPASQQHNVAGGQWGLCRNTNGESGIDFQE
jgi:hypothetical protein